MARGKSLECLLGCSRCNRMPILVPCTTVLAKDCSFFSFAFMAAASRAARQSRTFIATSSARLMILVPLECDAL
jgi:hypothetical protein